MPWILLHQTWQIYPSQLSIDALNTTTLNLADLLADLPPSQLSIDTLNTATPNLADLPPSMEHRCLEYCNTKLGRFTGRFYPDQLSIDALNTATPNLEDLPPSQLSIDALNTSTPNLAELPPSMEHRCLEYCYTQTWQMILADLPPINWAEMPWILLQQTWQIYPHQLSIASLNTATQKLGRSTPTPSQLSIDALNTATPNLADLPPVN